jgi:hypothetical protein
MTILIKSGGITELNENQTDAYVLVHQWLSLGTGGDEIHWPAPFIKLKVYTELINEEQ